MRNYMEEAFAPITALNREIVAQDTWGHLAPKRGVSYPGYIVFIHGGYGDIVPVTADFEGLPDSPWFFEDMCEFIAERDTEAGTVYRFDGTYTKFKNGSCRFSGKIQAIDIPRQFHAT